MIGQFSLFTVLALALVAEIANSALAPAATDEFGDHVSLRVNDTYICSGGRYGHSHVLTSAQCVMDLESKEKLVIVMGSLSSTNTNGAGIYTARNIVIHPEFIRENPISHNIAVIAFEPKLLKNSVWGPPMHSRGKEPPSTVAGNLTGTVTGYSNYNVSSSNTELLKKITVKTLTTEECQPYEAIVDEGQFCASVESGQGSCVVDDGAPLVINNQFEGILSDGNPCGGGIPGIFTSFDHYILWVYDVMYYDSTENTALAPAEAEEFPYQVSVRINGSHACGGAIVGYGHIVTSAKCVVDLHTKDDLVVVTGSLSSTDGGRIHKPLRIAIHPNFARQKPDFNDIAVILLERPIEYNADQGNVFWPSRHMPDDVVATLTGWRWDTYSVRSNAGYLKKLTVRAISSEKCLPHDHTVNITQICASVNSGFGTCMADVGAPLVYDHKLIGVLSKGNPCSSGVPSVFTNVSHYIDWMYDVMYIE